MRIVELILDEDQIAHGIDAISIVSAPAIESNFIALKKHNVKFATLDADKRILMGPALIPDKPIYRNQDGEEFYCYFSQNTVRRASELYLTRGNQNNATLEHEFNIHGLSLVETWIKEDMVKDKSSLYGLNDPIGTWMVTMKVANDQIWNEYVKTGLVKGFSIEGFFAENSSIKAKKLSVNPELDEYIKSLGYTKI